MNNPDNQMLWFWIAWWVVKLDISLISVVWALLYKFHLNWTSKVFQSLQEPTLRAHWSVGLSILVEFPKLEVAEYPSQQFASYILVLHC